MPHIDIKMYPGRSDDEKMKIAKKTQEIIAEEMKLDEKYVSVAIEEVEKDDWKEFYNGIPKEQIFVDMDF